MSIGHSNNVTLTNQSAEEKAQGDIVIPHKSMPNVAGKVYHFHKLSSKVWEWDEVANAVRDTYLVDEYLDLIAYELSHTRIAMYEAEYPTTPSVLILRNEKSSASKQKVKDPQNLRTYLRTHIVKNTEVRTFSPYGPAAKNAENKTEQQDEPFFSESEFLSRINVDAATNVHYMDDFPLAGGELAKRNLEAAQKFFDFVLISPLLPTPFADSSITKHYGLTRDHVKDEKSRVSKIVSVGTSIPRAVVHAEHNPDDLIAFDIANVYPGAYGYERFSVPASVVRASVVDIIKDMLGIRNSTPVVSFADKLSKRDKKAVVVKYEEGVVEPAVVVTFGSSVLFGLIFAFSGFDLSLPILVAGLTPVGSLGFLSYVVNKWLLYRRKQTKLVRQSLRTGMNMEERVKKVLHPQIPVNSSAISAAFNRTAALSVKVERVHTEGWSSTEVEHTAALSMDSLQERISRLKEQWMEYELDPIKALDFPLMLDATCKYTAAFLRSMNELEYAQRETEKDPSRTRHLATAVARAEESFYAAESYASKKALTLLTQEERGEVSKARQLAAVMKDKASTPHEKRLAYQQANKLIDGILPPLSSKVIGLLEQ